jgi:hypothetical protein
MIWVLSTVALGVGIYVGLGMPGTRGRDDRVVAPGRAKRLRHNYIHWLRPQGRR